MTCFIACFALVFVTFKTVTPLILFETNTLKNRKQKSYKNPISPRPNQGVDKVSLTNKHFLLTYELSFSAQQLALFSIVKIRISKKMSQPSFLKMSVSDLKIEKRVFNAFFF